MVWEVGRKGVKNKRMLDSTKSTRPIGPIQSIRIDQIQVINKKTQYGYA